MHKDSGKGKRHLEYDLFDDVEKIKAAIANAARDVRYKASDIYTDSIDDIKEKTASVESHVAEYVAEKPFKSLGVALLAGIAIGFILRK